MNAILNPGYLDCFQEPKTQLTNSEAKFRNLNSQKISLKYLTKTNSEANIFF